MQPIFVITETFSNTYFQSSPNVRRQGDPEKEVISFHTSGIYKLAIPAANLKHRQHTSAMLECTAYFHR